MSALEARSEGRFVGLGDRRYCLDQSWLKFPTSSPKGFVSAIAVAPDGRTFLLNRGTPVVQVFSNAGEFMEEWRSPVVTHGHAMCLDGSGQLYVVDSDRHCVHLFGKDGKVQTTLGRTDHPAFGRPFNHPTDVAVGLYGDLYVSDGYGNSHIHQFSRDGTWVRSWGGPGAGPGQFTNPHALCVTKQKEVWAVDRENNRVQRFTANGAYMSEITDLHHPTSMREDSEGYVYITDQTPRLSMYDPNGSLVGRCRTFGAIGHSICIDRGGDIYISDMMPNSISRFRREK